MPKRDPDPEATLEEAKALIERMKPRDSRDAAALDPRPVRCLRKPRAFSLGAGERVDD
jgi:hypothetical protein